MAQKKYASLSTLSVFLENIKNIFASKTDLSAEIAKKADIVHSHDDIYYTETEIDAKLADKSDATHNHNDDYSDINHNHDGVYAVANHNHDEKYDTKGAASSTVSTHNTSTSAHNDIRLSITDLTTKLNNFLDVDDTTADQLSELIALIQDNASDIEAITSGKVNVSDIVNNLTTNVSNKPLSAAQGVEIKALIDSLQNAIDAKSDWNQNDSTKSDYIYNRPFYTTDPIETVIAEGTIPANGMMRASTSMGSLTLGETYSAVFDGTAYNNLVAADYDGLPTIMNDSFMFAIQSGMAMAYAADYSASHSLKVMGYTTTVVPLERKYIAEHIDTFAGEKVNGKVYTIDGAQVTAGIGAEVFNDYSTNIASGKYSHAEGMNNVASGMLSHAEGWGTKASGSYSHTEGQETTASESYSHAEGWKTEATNRAAHAEGLATHATGQFSHAEGDNATAAGRASHAEGYSTNATADYSHAEGMNATATGSSSHAEGSGTQATGYISHAEGWDSVASGDSSHAEGCETIASGDNSHAEGYRSEASGWNSHAEGWSTLASGEESHAEGYGTIAASDYQHVQGKCNIEDADGKYAHIVGNGSSNSNRANIHTLDWNGNSWFKGEVYVGGTSADDNSASRVVTEADHNWTLIYDSGEIPSIVNSISGIDVSGYTNFEILVRCYNDGDSQTTRTGSVIFKAQNGKSYQFPVWTNMFTKSISTASVMAQFKLVDGWLVCPYASKLTGDIDIFDTTEGGTAGNLTHTGSGMMKCTSPLSTLTISNLDQNSNFYFGSGSRVMVWGWNA